jgi:predicted enzyme involved in methoxymalonyl-ACP biosynthesis
VLNRSVEEAICQWMLERAAGRTLIGEYRPTEKNGLVADLYARLGFRPDGEHLWRFEAAHDQAPQPIARLVPAS